MADIKWEPYKEEPAQAGGPPQGEITEDAGAYLAKSAQKGASEQMGRNFEAGVPIMMNGIAGIPESMLRAFLPREWVDKVFPVGALGDRPVEVTDPITGQKSKSTFRKAMLNKDNVWSPESLSAGVKRGKAGSELTEDVGAGLESAGQWAANPLGGPMKLVRGGLMAMGAGMGGEVGKKVGGGFGSTIGDMWDRFWGSKGGKEMGEKVGGVAGAVGGGGVGAQANVVRGKAVSVAGTAMGAAWKARKEDARESLTENFKDNYSAINADAKGVIQEHVNEKLAETLAKNPSTGKNVTEFDEAATRIGIDPERYDLAQRTDDPSLKLAVRTQQPRNLEEGQALAQRDQAQKKEILDAYKKATGETTTAKEVADAMEDVRQSTNARITALEAVKKREQDALPHLNPEERAQQGEGLQKAYKAKMEEVRPIRDGWYAEAKAADTLDPKHYDLKGVEAEVGEILDSTLARMDRSTVPESIVKLKGLIDKAKGTPDKVERVEKRPGLFEHENVPGKKGEPITYGDVEDMFKALNREMPKDRTEARNLMMIQQSLYKAFGAQASPELKAAYDRAQEKYRTLYAPMFKEGANFNLDRRAGVSRKGEAYYSPDQGMKPYLDEQHLVSRMKNFDDLFGGGKLGKRDEKAYQELSTAISDQYHREMFGPGKKYTEALHSQFMDRFSPVFERVPGAKEKIEQQALKVFELQSQQAREVQSFREAIKSPLNQAVGVQNANRMIADALADPRRMNSLISATEKHGGVEALMKDVTSRFNVMQGGVFDPQKMEELLNNAGPGLQVLFEKALGGRVQAQSHLQTLKDIALVAKRQDIMGSRMMPPAERLSHDPIRGATGSGGASWMSMYRSTSQGYTSIPYVSVLAGGRFLNQSLQNSLKAAEIRAFNEPEVARAVLEMYSKKAGEPISLRSAKAIFGKGSGLAADTSSKIINWFLDRGYIEQTMAKGGQLGLSNYADERERH